MKIIFAGGGTGGHLFPGVAIAQEILKIKHDTRILFVGTERGIEATEVPKLGFPLHIIPIAGIKRGFGLKELFENLKFPSRLLKSLLECRRLIEQIRPSAVVGTGGFVSGPVVLMAQMMGIPTLVQEQNSKPGITTRLLARRATEVHLSFEASRQFFSRKEKVFVTGNPTRDFAKRNPTEARRFFGLDPDKKTLLVFGGSLGARSINQAVESWLDSLPSDANLIWQTGRLEYDAIAKRVGKRQNVWYNAFIDRMDMAYSAADVVLCRAGASTIAELTNLGKPAILVPFPFAAGNHQYFNAKALSDKGAAVLIENKNIGQDQSKELILRLIDDRESQKSMAEACMKFGKPDAAATIAEHVVRLTLTSDKI
ncbi:MAG: undecaprenyldiphospho-muramoylpentapeptide beta-N-acetylglucosaminyltransferase [Chlorobiales bacterium]|nr:undecaprenyldiphospho-muramoylpentapeptide beta-N-acetylglucosaminyltransferase [Chlorobiales bacterium]